MSALRFCFVLHIHQPVGNFDHVFREHAEDVYRPFLDYLDDRGLWPIGLHASGPLIEWLGENDVALHDRIGRLAADGRIELLSAGWYEPVLAALPREDRATQLGWSREEIERRFGVTPTGLWLTERVWEPDLPRDLAEAGIEYALVDDHLARRAGVDEPSLRRPLRTEAQGRRVDLLPIDERLRYLIPFRPAEEIDAELRARHASGEPLALLGDDGEKFGGWPRTKEWLYEGGWLETFADRMDALRDEGVVRLVTPATARRELGATGPVYLPSGSYPELEEWALGGHWKGFLARYEESNRMHERMLALSDACRRRGDPEEIRRAIGRAQCNDAYWHGVFGGLYMKHLREGVRAELSKAERMLRAAEDFTATVGDHDASGRTGWWAHGPAVSAWVDARYGGTITELVWLERGVDVLDVLTRRREAYHEEAVARAGRERAAEPPPADAGAHGEDGTSGSESIHEIEASAVLDRLPPVDPEPRALVRDRVLSLDIERRAYEEGAFDPVWAPGDGRWVEAEPAGARGGGAPADRRDEGPETAAEVSGRGRGEVPEEGPEQGRAEGRGEVPEEGPANVLAAGPGERPGEGPAERAGVLAESPAGQGTPESSRDGQGTPESSRDGQGRASLTWRLVPADGPRVEKTITIREDGAVTIEWAWSPADFPERSVFAPELSLGAPVAIELSPDAASWRYPIVTVSKCPDGFERIEQGESVTPRWPISEGRARLRIVPEG